MIDFYTAPSPNGWKVSIFLEEAGIPYNVISLDLANQEQKSPAFSAINPNGKIPAIVDQDAGGLPVWESESTLYHLANKTGQFLQRIRAKSADNELAHVSDGRSCPNDGASQHLQ